MIELTEDLSASPLYNKDLAPTRLAQRTWNRWHLASLWIGMSVCIPTYMLAAGLLSMGMTWVEAIATIFLGNLIVLVPMVLIAHAGTKYGIPLPVFLRASFGASGAHVPSILRGLVACGWFGIQTWIGGAAIYTLACILWPGLKDAPGLGEFLGINAAQLACFLLFWAMNVYFIVAGTESIKWLETASAPVLLLIGVALLTWGWVGAGGLGRALRHSENFARPPAVAMFGAEEGLVVTASPVEIDGQSRATEWRVQFAREYATQGWEGAEWRPLQTEARCVLGAAVAPTRGESVSETEGMARLIYAVALMNAEVYVQFRNAEHTTQPIKIPADTAGGGSKPFWAIFLPLLTAMVGFWATLALNIPDFTRFAKSQRDQAIGQAIGLPTTMTFYSFVGVAVTCAALVIFPDILVPSEAPWDPVALLSRFHQPGVVIVSMIMLVVATLTTNIAANVVAPANSLANLAPKSISFRLGGILTALLGIAIMPWKLLASPKIYIFDWLIGYGALLGPIAGILIADYYLVRRTKLDLADLYRERGRYGRFNVATLAILLLAIAPNVPGFLVSAKFVAGEHVPDVFESIFQYAWFVGFGIAFALHSMVGRLRGA